MRYHYVKSGDETDNQDLFCLARNVDEAIAHWRHYYELEADAKPERVWRLPNPSPGSKGGAMPWCDLIVADFRPEGGK